MMHINLYSNKKAHVLSWAKAFMAAGYNCKAIERTCMNGTPGHSKYCLTIYAKKRVGTQAEFKAFEEKVLELYRGIINN